MCTKEIIIILGKCILREEIFLSYRKLMYKTTVYTLVNGRITHQKQQISEKVDITQHDIA